MKLTIEGTESEIKNVLQAIGSSKEHEKFEPSHGTKNITNPYQKAMTRDEYEKLVGEKWILYKIPIFFKSLSKIMIFNLKYKNGVI